MKLAEVAHEWWSLRSGYPAFVSGRRGMLEPGEVPVFVFHTVAERELEAQLEYLRVNGYRTLTLQEFVETQRGIRRPASNEILLTFDDARSSFWRIAFPLLKRHEARAVLFAITGWTRPAGRRPNLEDVWAGRLTAAELHALDPGDHDVCTWEELRAMHSSGIVCVDSHSHLHRRVFVDREPVGVVQPDADFSATRAVHSAYLSLEESPLASQRDEFIGLPLFRCKAFMQGGASVRLDRRACEDFRTRALELAAGQGGSIRSGQLAELARLLPSSAFRAISPEESRREMRAELARAQQELRRELDDPDAGRSFCVPFTLGCDAVRDVCRELHITTVFWGVSSERRANLPGADPSMTVRIKQDFLFRLDGQGRKSLASVYLDKIRRRAAGERPY